MYDSEFHGHSIAVLQIESQYLYARARAALEVQNTLRGVHSNYQHEDLVSFQQRAAALSLAARVLMMVESPLPYFFAHDERCNDGSGAVS